ncbi:MAG TPA: L,D-transpeptidase family protein [Micromonosporaceae bacterium]|nr:L,D-transpeptidase family protein [Micromonosporaceae bacterium]
MATQVSRLLAVAVAVLVGAGACAFGPQRERGAGGLPPAPVADGTTGASAPPGPGRSTPAGGITPPAASSPAPTQGPARPTRPPSPAGCPQGEHQREVETYLARLGGFGPVTVDGRQSAGDCAAIIKFQRRYGISPAAGRAGPTTVDVARRLAFTRTGACRTGGVTTVCVNLALQTVWVMRGDSVLLRPTVTRTGMSGFATPAGTFAIDATNPREWSVPYQVWMPYWQHFYGGMGFHETTTYLHDPSLGSHGCVNLLPQDARQLWDLAGVGTRVYLFGRRPGT